MEAGQTIARRYVLTHEEPSGISGVTRFVATDTRLDTTVTLLHVDTVAPTAAVRRAQHMRTVRDKRLCRVLSAGFEGHGTDRQAYIVTARAKGVSMGDLLGVVPFAPDAAAALIGAAAATLVAPSGRDLHHGFLSADSLTVTSKGHVAIEGLGIHGELAMQSGEGHGDTERADALALASMYLTALTAMPSAEVTEEDLPDDLDDAARDLAVTAIKGSGPTTLAAITAALGTGSSTVLRDLAAQAPRLWWSYEVPVDAPPTDTVGAVLDDADYDHPDGQITVDSEGAVDVDDVVVADPDVVADDLPTGELVALDDAGTDVEPARPRTVFGNAVDDLDEFTDIVAEQNIEPDRSLAEAGLTWLSDRFPQSRPLARAAAAAHTRAQTPAPLVVGPLLLALALVVVFIAGLMAWHRLQEPFVPDFDVFDHPPQEYPQYTFSPSPSPTPAADA